MKKIIIGLILLGVIVASLFFSLGKFKTVDADRVKISSDVQDVKIYNQDEVKNELESVPNEEVDLSKPVTIDGVKYYLFTQSDMDELQGWMKSKGYLNPNEGREYKEYSDEVLKELAKIGDFKALDILNERALNSGDEQARKQYLGLAAIHGSTSAFFELSRLAFPRQLKGMNEGERRLYVIEALAIKKVMTIRGDHNLAGIAGNTFEQEYKLRFGIELILSENEQKVVDTRAEEIYKQFQALRYAHGLGGFDNSEPDSVKKYAAARR